jgi:acyl dehydratase
MTTDQLVALAAGQLIAAGMFVLGIAVGVSLTRKDSTNDNSDTEAAAKWHRIHDSLR